MRKSVFKTSPDRKNGIVSKMKTARMLNQCSALSDSSAGLIWIKPASKTRGKSEMANKKDGQYGPRGRSKKTSHEPESPYPKRAQLIIRNAK